MTVATRAIPKYTVDTASAYKAKIDSNAMVDQAISGAFACHAAATPNMTILCDAGAISFAGQIPTIVGQQTSGTITAPATNPRNDLVVIDSNSGTMSVITGTPAASPADPVVPEGSIPVARISMATSTTTITNTIITDLRAPVLAVQGSQKSLTVSSNTTLTQKQSGLDVFCSGASTTVTLPSATGCKGARFRFMGTDANTQTLSGSLSYPNGTTASSHSLVNHETLDVESNGTLWRVVNRQGGIGIFGSFTLAQLNAAVSDANVAKAGANTDITSLTNPTLIGYTEAVVAIGVVGASRTLSLASGTEQTATLTSATPCTFTMPAAAAGKSFVLLLKQPATGSPTTAAFTGVKWGTAGAPIITAVLGKMDILSFISDGTNWYGSISQGYTP